jgi:glycosidase
MKMRLLLGVSAISFAGAVFIPSHATVEYVDPAVAASLSQVMPRPVNSTESTYFLLTDRYANGTEDNDYGGGYFQGGFDPYGMYNFHGGDFVGLTANLDRLKRLGFTSIWVTPPVVNDDNGYHGYWGIDFMNVDPHLGTNEEFKTFVDTAHSKGMKVIMDIVVNHTANLIRYTDNDDETFFTLAERPYKDAAGTVFDLESKAAFTNTCETNGEQNCFPMLNAGSFPHTYAQSMTELVQPDFLKDPTNYHNRGDATACNWVPGDCQMFGDFIGLDDVFTEKPEVVQGWIDAYGHWVREYGIDGFRFDTAKHVNKEFWASFVPAMNAAAADVNKGELTMFSEAWMDDPYQFSEWYRSNAPQSALDFPAQKTFTRYGGGYGNGSSLLSLLARDDYFNTGNQPGVTRNAYGLTTFLGNHDMGRGNAKIIANTGDTGTNLTKRVQLTNAVMFLLRGAPSVYYGDELGLIGSGGDADARQDLMSTTYMDQWQTEERVGAGARGTKSLLSSKNETHPLFVYIKSLQTLRNTYPALKDGATIARMASDKVAAWSRIRLDGTKADSRREYVVVTNSGINAAVVTVPVALKNARYVGVFGTKSKPVSSSKYGLKITVPARSALVFRSSPLLPGLTSAPRPTVSVANDPMTSRPMISAVAISKSRDPLSVTFLARTNSNDEWRVIGTDDSPTSNTYKLVLDEWVWESSTMQFAAVTRTSNGRTAGSAVLPINRVDVDLRLQP